MTVDWLISKPFQIDFCWPHLNFQMGYWQNHVQCARIFAVFFSFGRDSKKKRRRWNALTYVTSIFHMVHFNVTWLWINYYTKGIFSKRNGIESKEKFANTNAKRWKQRQYSCVRCTFGNHISEVREKKRNMILWRMSIYTHKYIDVKGKNSQKDVPCYQFDWQHRVASHQI